MAAVFTAELTFYMDISSLGILLALKQILCKVILLEYSIFSTTELSDVSMMLCPVASNRGSPAWECKG